MQQIPSSLLLLFFKSKNIIQIQNIHSTIFDIQFKSCYYTPDVLFSFRFTEEKREEVSGET